MRFTDEELIRKYPLQFITGNKYCLLYKQRNYHPVGGVVLGNSLDSLNYLWKRVQSSENDGAVPFAAYRAELQAPDLELQLAHARFHYDEEYIKQAKNWILSSVKYKGVPTKLAEELGAITLCPWELYSYWLPDEDKEPYPDTPTKESDPDHEECQLCYSCKFAVSNSVDLEALAIYLYEHHLISRFGDREIRYRAKKKLPSLPTIEPQEPGPKITYPIQGLFGKTEDKYSLDSIFKPGDMQSVIAIGCFEEIDIPSAIIEYEASIDTKNKNEKLARQIKSQIQAEQDRLERIHHFKQAFKALLANN